MHIVGLSGSLRPQSWTTIALRHALDGARAAGATVDEWSEERLRLPLCDGERNDGEVDAAVLALRQAARAADGFVWATPEYHGAMSGVLKNALDWLSRTELGRKPVGLVGISAGAVGGIEALTMLRVVARSVHANAVVEQAAVAFASRALQEPVDAKLLKRLHGVGEAVVHTASSAHKR
jgi:FMN reductase